MGRPIHGQYVRLTDGIQHSIFWQSFRTSARTIDPKALKNVDESYDEYEFIIRTAVEPWSRYLEKQEEKSAKRDAKGKKKRSVNELM